MIFMSSNVGRMVSQLFYIPTMIRPQWILSEEKCSIAIKKVRKPMPEKKIQSRLSLRCAKGGLTTTSLRKKGKVHLSSLINRINPCSSRFIMGGGNYLSVIQIIVELNKTKPAVSLAAT